MKAIAFAVALLLTDVAFASSPTPNTTQEINSLFATLRVSGCEFFRNGSWYSAEKASDHLQGKYEAVRKKGLITNTESFITLAASKSSLSGKAYEVRCGTAAPVSSQSWFTKQLDAIRARAPR